MLYLKDYKVIKENNYSGSFYKPSTLIKECLGMIGSEKEDIGNKVLSHIHNKGHFEEATIEYRTNANPIIKREHWADSSIIELVLINLISFSYHIKDMKIIWYYNTNYPTINVLEVFKGNSIRIISLEECTVELVKLYTKYYSLQENCKERLLLRYELNIPSNNNRNSMGCSESWYNFEYAMMETFNKEEIESMSDTEFAHLNRLATNIQEGLY